MPNTIRGGRPRLGKEKRIQQSTTYRRDLYNLMRADMERSGLNTDGRTHNVTLSMIVEQALEKFYAKRLTRATKGR